jgi:hypothetical protein
VKTTLVAAVVVGIWLAPTAYADDHDQAFLSFLAANKVAIDTKTAIDAAHVACAQIAEGETNVVVAAVVNRQFPTINGNEYWIAAGARKAYCPN